jgi:hypothetical protein
MEVVETMTRRMIHFMCQQKTKWLGEKTKELNNLGFKFWYIGEERISKEISRTIKTNIKQRNQHQNCT